MLRERRWDLEISLTLIHRGLEYLRELPTLDPTYPLLALFSMPHINKQLLVASTLLYYENYGGCNFFTSLGNTFLARCLRNSKHNYAKARVDEKFSQGNQIAFCQESLSRQRGWCDGEIVSFVENAEFAY